MGKTLAKVVFPAEAQCRDPSKKHLYPAHDRHHLAHYPMANSHIFSNNPVNALFQVQLEIDPEADLQGQHEHQARRER
jgi:hypothetical protein